MGTEKDPHRLKLAEPAHPVELAAYEIDVFEVTNGQFARFQIESDYEAEGDWRSHYTIGREDFPVANVTWNDAKEYCAWAGGRLPTEAEWEKAARGTEGLRYPWGDVFDWNKANTNEHGVRDTVEVGTLPEDKSPYGAYDMVGNVQEWTATELEPYPDAEIVDRNVFQRNYITVRGCSYAMKGEGMYLFSRTAAVPNALFGYGFRCVKDVPGQEEAPQE
jgi:formylglycine-generating enzyme required for sulfatase activity